MGDDTTTVKVAVSPVQTIRGAGCCVIVGLSFVGLVIGSVLVGPLAAFGFGPRSAEYFEEYKFTLWFGTMVLTPIGLKWVYDLQKLEESRMQALRAQREAPVNSSVNAASCNCRCCSARASHEASQRAESPTRAS